MINKYEVIVKIINDDFSKNTILDFGGRSGNFLINSGLKIYQENYTVIDVSENKIIEGKEKFPKSNWIFYNKFNPVYNSNGNINEYIPNVKSNFDYILMYSVVTHTDFFDFKNIVDYFYPKFNKKMVITFIDVTTPALIGWLHSTKKYNNKTELELSFKPALSKYYTEETNFFKDINYIYCINHNILIIEEEQYTQSSAAFTSLYRSNFLKDIFKKYNPKIIKKDYTKEELLSMDFLRPLSYLIFEKNDY